MRAADDSAVLARWLEQASRLDNVRVRADLVRIVLVFAELAGRLVAWSDALKEWKMIESQLVLEWTADARRKAELTTRREDLLLTLKERFPDRIPEEIVDLINRQESMALLQDWLRAGLHASSLDELLAVLRR
jgi:hypothetical protein